MTISNSNVQRQMEMLDPFYWLMNNKLKLSADRPWNLESFEYQVAWLQERAREQCFIKGAQIGCTEVLVLKTLHGMVNNKYKRGALYLFPTRDDIRDFSKARFDPIIENNPFIKKHVTKHDAQNIKQIKEAFLYLRGSKSSSQLKSIPVDRLVFDEIDEIGQDMVRLAKERTASSENKEIMYLGTPTIPDYGVDKLYQGSDQRVWMVRCPSCRKHASLDLEFPNSLQRQTDGSVKRVCIHCGAEVNPRYGEWVAQYPGRDMVGWWLSQLNSLRVDPTQILDEYEDPPYGNLTEVMNSNLGRAYIPAENRLTQSDVVACCGNDPMMTRHDGPCCMGIDVGSALNVVIAAKPNRNTLHVIKICRVSSFNDIHDLIKRFNIRSTVIDLKPEIRKVREFQAGETHSVFACNYVETRTGITSWDEKSKTITCNRTEICDASHELVIEQGRLILPRMNSELKEFSKQMCNTAKVLEENAETGDKTFRYKGKLGGPDDYRHAMNYCLLASERIGTTADKNLIGRYFLGRRRRSWMTS